MNSTFKKEILIVFLFLVMGFVLRFYTFDRKSLWLDEIYTFNESRYGLKDQFTHYKQNPTYLQPPLFYLLTHLFYPFPKPERDLRIIPLIFGTLSIPMVYLLSRQFSASIAIPCTLSLTSMVYHISLSQDGRSYSLLLFLGMAGLYFLMKHIKTSRKKYLIPAAISFALSFYTNYAFTPFLGLLQLFWFYQADEETKRPLLKPILLFNALLLLLCFSWVLFAALTYKGQPFLETLRQYEETVSLWEIIYNTLRDWTPNVLVTILSILLLFVLLYLSRPNRNALILLGILFVPIGGSYLFFRLFNISHFITPRYLVNLLPIFLISIYMSIDNLALRFERFGRSLRLKSFFVLLFVVSNLVILPFYYHSQKQDFMGLVAYLKHQLKEGDKIYVVAEAYIPGILHYFGVYPEGRQYLITWWKDSTQRIGYKASFVYRNEVFTIYHSKICCTQYVQDRTRLWLIVPKRLSEKFKSETPCVFKGYFDGSFLNFKRFPTDASMFLFLWDPSSSNEKGIHMPIQ